TDSYRESERYWVEQRIPTLPGAPEVPMAKTPATVDIPYFVHRGIRVDKETWRRIQAAANERGLTPDVAVCAAFSEVLGYWCKSPRLTLNVLSFQRMPLHHHINHIVGNFGSTVLLGVDAAQGKTFTERAHIIHEQLLQDLAHWNFSGVRVLRELNRRRGGTTGATMPVVFASTLNYSYTTGADPSLHPAESFYEQELRYIQLQTPQVWFDHQVAEDKGELVLEWDIVEDLFPEGLLDAMWAAYLRLLYRLADDPRAWDAAEGRGWLLPAEQLAEREAVNATAAELPVARLEALVAKAAAQRPTAPAVISGRGTLSYSTLEARATEVGLWLQGRGVSPDRLVAVVMEPGWEQVVAALGVLKAGAAYLPIEPTQPTERLHYLLAHSQASLVLTQAEWDARLEWPAGVERLVVENAPRPGGQVRRPDPGQVDDLAYVIYTSGSTGQPKGVMIDHRGAANTILDLNHRFGVGPGDTALSVSSLGFDLSVYDIFGMLAAGGRVVLPDTTQWREPAEWLALMHEHRVTIWNSVPALMEMLVEHVASRGEQWPASLRLVMLSGDWIPVGLPDRIRALGAGVEVISLGGATEASIWSIAYPIGAVDPAWESIPYGRPLRNQRFAVLNDALEPTPVWVPGQLYIGGVGLARGYWRDEEKTRAAFITHPRTGERLYRTGDLGRYLPGGDIQFLGREDLQVKVRGYRIELGEIETALQQHGAVQTAVVVAVGTSNEQRRLVAYVVGRGAEALEPDALTSFLHTKLPDYMVPAQIVTLEALPLTANGKVDRGRLASPAWLALQQERTNVVAPRDATEEQLAAIWSDLLSVRELSVHDSFFTLGGNSLMVTQVVARISETFGVELPLRSVYQAPTVAGLAAVIRAGGVMATEDLDLAAEAVLDPSVAAAS
ncbi:MAG TPA: amino acid adenylation domain-containing protein, partial [Vicinamibacterales bacterium]